jgi:hypothetical protein
MKWQKCDAARSVHLSFNKIDGADSYVRKDGCAVDTVCIQLDIPSPARLIERACIKVNNCAACLPAAT